VNNSGRAATEPQSERCLSCGGEFAASAAERWLHGERERAAEWNVGSSGEKLIKHRYDITVGYQIKS